MKRSGTADLPLHGGRVPAWLGERMTQLGTAVVEHIVASYGTSGFLTRLSDPFWFQALGCVMGMDWHSSGITTSVMGALKRGLNPRSSDLGIYICGGRGRHSRRTPDELHAYSGHTGWTATHLPAPVASPPALITMPSATDFSSICIPSSLVHPANGRLFSRG